jgi:hypothetical protein
VEETMARPAKGSSVASGVESVAAQPARRRTVAVARARVLVFIPKTYQLLIMIVNSD